MSKKISIKEPCFENFFEMENSELGKFCHQCSKNVVDIRNKKSFEINSDTGTCIFAEKNQLKTPFLLKRLATGTIIATSTLALTACNDTKTSVDTEISSTHSKENISIIEGKVVSGILNLSSIDNAEVQFIRLDTIISTKTDENGKFRLEIPTRFMEEKNLISIAHSDYEPEQKLIPKNELLKPLKIALEKIEQPDSFQLGEMVYLPNDSTIETYIDGERKTEKEIEQIFDIDTMRIKHHLFFDGEFAKHLAKNDSIKEVSLIFTEK